MDEERKRQIEREARLGRQPTLADLIGAKDGGGFSKGGSPVPPLVQVANVPCLFVREHLGDHLGALRATLERIVRTSEALLTRHQHEPLAALRAIIERHLASEDALEELVRQADVQWGSMMAERPLFQGRGEPAHPDDEYTHESVRRQLEDLLRAVEGQSSA